MSLRTGLVALMETVVGHERVWPQPLGDGQELTDKAAVTYMLIPSEDEEYSHDGPAGVMVSRFQIEAWSKRQALAEAEVAGLYATLKSFSGDLGGAAVSASFVTRPRDDYEDETELYRLLFEVEFQHS